jgi:hypothetical protein
MCGKNILSGVGMWEKYIKWVVKSGEVRKKYGKWAVRSEAVCRVV